MEDTAIIFGTISDKWVFIHPNCINIMNLGISVSCEGTIICARYTMNNTLEPLNFNLAKAYPASVAEVIATTVLITATLIELK